MRALVAFVLFGVGAALPARASDTEYWNGLVISGPARENSRLLLWFDGHARIADGADELSTGIVRPGLGYKLNDDLSLWAGYAFVTSRNAGDLVDEHRTWQQATYPVTSIFGGTLSGRTRLEQRFRDNADETGHRIRQFIRWSAPIDGPLSLVLWNETFIGFNRTNGGNASGYQQNRGFAGLGYTPASRLRVEAGYLNNHLRVDSAPDRFNHNVSLTMFVGL